jgi:hypothetical protein
MNLLPLATAPACRHGPGVPPVASQTSSGEGAVRRDVVWREAVSSSSDRPSRPASVGMEAVELVGVENEAPSATACDG